MRKLMIKQAAAAVLALLTLLLASCDPSGDGNATEAPTESGEVTTPPTEDVTTPPRHRGSHRDPHRGGVRGSHRGRNRK